MSIEKVLVVDDEVIMRNFLVEALKRKGLEAVPAENGLKATQLIKEQFFDLVITDMRMPKMTGLELLKQIKEIAPRTLVVVMTAFGTIENAVEAMQCGAFHYLIKPCSLESIMANIEKANQHLSLVEENTYLREQVNSNPNSRPLIAESPAMKKVLQEVEQIAKSNANVFINGETGTGKEVMAHLVHYSSPRASQPFIKVNCAAVPDSLVESEFFGHEKGAFTGAAAKRLGRFELADKGSLLLDEVTEIPLALQAKLLRVTQEQEFERVGGGKSIKVNVRLISTSNRDMKEAIADKVLREDLYYRLNVVPIHLPSLREREEDIVPLAEYFIKQTCQGNHVAGKELSREAKAKLISYRWPGNVRELANVIERAVVMDQGNVIQGAHLYLDGPTVPHLGGRTLHEAEKQLILETLERHVNRDEAAEVLGINIKMLRSKLREYDLV
jgi:two-component system response regulator AtoC